jgi:hypothetical protein
MKTFDFSFVLKISLCEDSNKFNCQMKKSSLKTFFIFFKFTVLLCIILLNFSCWKFKIERKTWTKVKTFAGMSERFGEPFGVAIRGEEIFVSDGEQGKIWKISNGGAMTVFAENLHTPSQIVFDRNGDLIVADSGAHVIKRIKQNGETEIVAGVENKSGYADGGARNALFDAPIGVAVSEDKIFVADTYNDKIRVIENGKVSTLAGSEQGFADSENGQKAKFDTPCGIAVKGVNLIVADAGNRRLRLVEESGKTSTYAGNGAQNSIDGNLFEASFVEPIAVSVGNFGEIYVADGNSIRAIGRRFFPLVETISNRKLGFSDGNLRTAKFNRPSGLTVDDAGNLFVADSENQVLRVFTGEDLGREISVEELKKLNVSAEEFRKLAAPRWAYNPPQKSREIAGTLGEIRGDASDGNPIWFHNGLDVVGGYGETARFVRTEKVLEPIATANFATLRELIRMPTLGYIHVRLGRDKDNNLFDDRRFQFTIGADKKLKGVRVPRGSKFAAGEAIGTLNPMNHVHLIAGRTGTEMNALDALILPGVSDLIAPVIEKVSLFDENWREIETEKQNSRIKLSEKTRVVVRAYDRMDGNAERRRLGVFKLGYQILREDETALTDEKTTISFALLPDSNFVRLVYAAGSKSGATGETIFNYIVSNEINGEIGRENFLDASTLEPGNYILRVFAADYFGNKAVKDIQFSK